MEKTKSKKKLIWIFVLLTSILCIAILSFIFLRPFVLQKLELRNAKSKASISTTNTESNKPKVETPVNFDELHKVNEEIYAWINIPNTPIDYPILQSSTDNKYYLSHSLENKKEFYGSIFTENYNKKDFSDFNTVIYGHNTKNKTMFGTLRNFKIQSFFNENKFINVYLPGRILKYEIFAAYVWNDRHILFSFDFTDPEVCNYYINMVHDIRSVNSHIDKNIPVTGNNKILTLSTCTNNENERYLVQGVLIYDSSNQ